jgi:hypothetical protein
MGLFTVPGSLSGRNYTLRIDGTEPTATERERISAYVSQQEAAFAEEYASRFGAPPEAEDYGRNAFGRGWERGVPQTRGLLGTAMRATGEASGIAALTNFGAQQEEAADRRLWELSMTQPEATRLGDVAGPRSALTFAGEALGENLPQLLGSVAGALGAATAAKPLGVGAAGAVVAGTLGGAATSAPLLFGGNVQRQEEQVAAGELAERDLQRALVATFGQAALEGVASSILAVRPFVGPAGAGLFTRMSRGAAAGVPSEALTEIGQQMIERHQAGLPIDSPDAYREYIEAGVIGGLLGGAAGGVFGAAPGRRDDAPSPDAVPTAAPPTPLALPPPDPSDAAVRDSARPTPVGPQAQGVQVHPAIAEARDAFDERVARIMQDGDVPLAAAETLAAQQVLQQLEAAGTLNTPVMRPFIAGLRAKAAADVAPAARSDTGPPTPPPEAYVDQFAPASRQLELPLEPTGTPQTVATPPTGEMDVEAAVRDLQAQVQETPDAQAPEAGPVESDDAADRAGVASDLAQPDLGPATPDAGPARAQPPVGRAVGEPVLDAPQPAAPARDQRTPLRDLGDLGDDFDIERLSPLQRDRLERGIRPNTTMEGVEATPVLPAATPVDPAVTLDGYNPVTGELPGQTTGLPGGPPPAPRIVDPPAQPGAEAAPDPGAARRAPSDPEGMTRVMDDLGVGPRAGIRQQVRRGEITTPEGFVQALERTRLPKAQGTLDDGTTRPAPAAARDEWVRGAREQMVEDARARQDDPTVARVVRDMQETREADTVRQEIAEWFESNASEDLRLADELAAVTSREPVQLRAADLRAVKGLIEQVRRDRGGENPTPAQAAFRYFGRTSDPVYALHMLASDAGMALAPSKIKKNRDGTESKIDARTGKYRTRRDILERGRHGDEVVLSAQERADVALLSGQGWSVAETALQWAEANLSPDAYQQLIAMRDGPYKWVDYTGRAVSRDRAKGARDGGRMGPVRTVDELSDVELAARKEAMARDQQALENEARESRGLTQEQWNALPPEVRRENVRDYQDLRDMDYGSPRVSTPSAPWVLPSAGLVGNGAGAMRWLSSAHPTVAARVASGDFVGAVRLMGSTASNAHLRALAQKILPRLNRGVRSRVLPARSMKAVFAALDPEAQFIAEGLYVRRASPSQLAAMRAEGHNDAADMIERFQDTVLISEDATVSNELLLHEALHALAMDVLDNPSLPFGRQLEAMRVNMMKFVPPTFYGMANKHEFLSEGLTNPEFRKVLSSVNIDGKPYPVWQQFKHAARSWVRGLMGYSTRPMDSALDTLDQVIDAVIASNPNEIASGDLMGAAFAASPLRDIVDRSMAAARVPTAADAANITRALRDTGVPASWKGTMLRALVPLDYVTDAAKKYFPSSNRVHDAVLGHQAAVRKNTDIVNQTIVAISEVLNKHRSDPKWAENTQRFLFQGSLNQVNVQKSRSAYEGWSYTYTAVDPATGRAEARESQRYQTERERNSALAAHNRALPPNAPRSERARRGFDMDPEQLAVYDRMRPEYDAMVRQDPAYAEALDRAFGLPVQMGKDLQTAIRARLEALIPNQRNLQNRVFGEIYNKILAEQLIDPYQPFRRSGDFWLSYSAVDPETVQYDAAGNAIPGTGRVEVFKHSFMSEAQRAYAIQQLQNMPQDQQVSGINAYHNVGSMGSRDRVPMEFVAKVLDTIEGSEVLRGDDNAAVRSQILELMFDTMPETSFVQSFRRRGNVRGFIADTTPLTDPLVHGDLMKVLKENSERVGRQVADLRYGAEFSAIRTALDTESRQTQERGDLSPGQKAEAAQYLDLLLDYTRAPFKQRSALSRGLTGGAYFATLGFNASTALITLSQIPLFVAPVLAGKYGVRSAIGAIGAATRLLAGAGRSREVQRVGPGGQMETVRVPTKIYEYSMQNYDFSDPRYAYLKALSDVGDSVGGWNRSMIQDELMAGTAGWWKATMGVASMMQHTMERTSREVAMISGYHLELQRLLGAEGSIDAFTKRVQDGELVPSAEQMQEAARYAVDMAEKTNGPMFASAGPQWAQGDIGGVAYLFKRHPLAMMNLYVQTAKRSFAGADPMDARIARRQLAGLLGMMGLMAGAMGLPFMQQVGWLYDMLWADDDEPDFESMMRMHLGEAGAFGLVDFLTGAKVSERIGLGGAIYRPGFASDRLPLPYQVLEGLGGPVLGLGLKYTTRVPQLAAEGRWDRFTEAVLPSSMANVARAIRFSREGALTMRGDPIVDDFSPLSLWGQAFGFMPAEYAQQLAANSMGSKINNAIETTRTRLLARRYRAFREGDWDTVQEIDREIQAFNERHPRNAITGDVKRNSLRSNLQTTSRMNHGVAVSPRNLQYIRDLSDAYGRATIWQ